MAKSLYSLMLSDEVMAEIDRMALRRETNRSNLVNQILAEACRLVTPEKRARQILSQLAGFFGDDTELMPFFSPNQSSMLIKTSLAYRYRPTLRYELRLSSFRGSEALGELVMTLRTQSAELLALTEQFFLLWISREKAVLAPYGLRPVYSYAAGRFSRTIEPQRKESEETALSQALTAYVRLLDGAYKAWIAGDISEHDTSLLLSRWAESGELL